MNSIAEVKSNDVCSVVDPTKDNQPQNSCSLMELNSEQIEAVHYVDGNVQVLVQEQALEKP